MKTANQISGRTPGSKLRSWNRAVFKVFGPAQIGDLSKPVPAFDPDPPCPRCGSAQSTHFMHRMADGKLRCRCPAKVDVTEAAPSLVA
jgi:hypothetical protein